jgi:2-acylglycerol O-acyltransferase 2
MPIAPYTDKPLVACFGKPIQFDKTTEPSQQQIDEVHEEYMQELIRVFDANKDELGYAGKELKVL